MSRTVAVTLLLVGVWSHGCGESPEDRGVVFDATASGSVQDIARPGPVDTHAVGDGSGPTVDTDSVACGEVVTATVTGGDALTRPWSHLYLEGQGFEAYEGRDIHLRVMSSLGPLDLNGQAKATIACGTFSFYAPEVLEYGAYKNLVLYVDEDGDGVCDDGVDTVWSLVTSAVNDDLKLQVEATDPSWQGGACWNAL